MTDCLFCKIAAGEIPSEKVYEDDEVYAFKDIDPKAPVHVLVIPKKHALSVLEADDETMSSLFRAARQIAAQFGLEENGFRLVVNTGQDGGQTVPHLHMHLLGGRALEWPPG